MKINILVFILILFAGCSSEDTQYILSVRVVDDKGLPVNNANVSLFKSKKDADLSRNQLGWMYSTNSNGDTRILTNQSGDLYLLAAISANCMDLFGRRDDIRNVIKINVVPGLSNYFKITISPTGRIFFVNESVNSYQLYIDSMSITEIVGKTLYTEDYVKLGIHQIRVVQSDTFFTIPIDQKYQVEIKECATELINFPR